jgi:hypothetical protein
MIQNCDHCATVKNETTVLFSIQAELAPTRALLFLISELENSFFPIIQNCDHCAMVKNETTVLFSNQAKLALTRAQSFLVS